MVVKPDIHLTNAAVETGKEVDFKVCIVRANQCEGYTVTRLGAMVTSVYFSNQATREQLRGRIDRITQHRLAKDNLFVEYVTVFCGVLKAVQVNYAKAAVVSRAMGGKSISKKDIDQLMGSTSGKRQASTSIAPTKNTKKVRTKEK